MTGEAAPLRALLVGVNHYLPSRTPGSDYPRLTGSVRDVRKMEDFLVRDLGVPPENVRRLTASTSLRGGEEPAEPPEDRPSAANLRRELLRLRDLAGPGDQVLIHYSGHGARSDTHLPEVKGAFARDECLVPYDARDPEVPLVRDFELSYLLRELVERGAFVALILDCCHSGGIPRREAAIRGLPQVDRVRRPPLGVAPPEALAEAWKARQAPPPQGGKPLRSFALGRSPLELRRGYVALAACLPGQFAYEEAHRGCERMGALTFHLLEALQTAGSGLTWRELYDRILGRIHRGFASQTPWIEGEQDRRVFGRQKLPARRTVLVLRGEEEEPGTVTLQAGEASGVRPGARFEVWEGETQLAVLDVTESQASQCRARVTERGREARPIRCGDGAVLLDANPGESGLRLAVSERGAWEVLDERGVPLPNLGRELPVGAPGAAEKARERLAHLVRFRQVARLEGSGPGSPVHGQVRIELGRLPSCYQPGGPIHPETLDGAGVEEVEEGAWLCATLRNGSERELNVALLALGPRWNVCQVAPGPRNGRFLVLEGGGEVRLPLRACVPPGFSESEDLLKAVATAGPLDCRWLELPPIGAGPLRNGSEGAAPPPEDWTTAEVRVKVRRRRVGG